MPLDHGCLSSKEYQSPMAQSVARQAVNLQVAGSNPAGGGIFFGQQADVPKRLRGWTRNPLGSARAGSSPAVCAFGPCGSA